MSPVYLPSIMRAAVCDLCGLPPPENDKKIKSGKLYSFPALKFVSYCV